MTASECLANGRRFPTPLPVANQHSPKVTTAPTASAPRVRSRFRCWHTTVTSNATTMPRLRLILIRLKTLSTAPDTSQIQSGAGSLSGRSSRDTQTTSTSVSTYSGPSRVCTHTAPTT